MKNLFTSPIFAFFLKFFTWISQFRIFLWHRHYCFIILSVYVSFPNHVNHWGLNLSCSPCCCAGPHLKESQNVIRCLYKQNDLVLPLLPIALLELCAKAEGKCISISFFSHCQGCSKRFCFFYGVLFLSFFPSSLYVFWLSSIWEY